MAEYDPFTIQPQGPTEYDPFGNYALGQDAKVNKDRKKDLLPSLLDVPREEIRYAVDVGADKDYVDQAKGKAQLETTGRAEDILQEGLQEGRDPQQTIMDITESLASNALVGEFIDPVVMSTVLSSDNELAKKTYTDKLKKVLILHDKMVSSMESASEDSWWRNFDFIDTLTTSIPIYSNMVVNERRKSASRISELLTSDLSDEEFSQELDTLFAQAADAGLLTNENRFLLSDLFSLLEEGGEGPEGKTQNLWAWFDTLAVLAAAPNTARKGVKGSKTAAALTEETTDAATLMGRTGREDVKEVLQAGILADDPQNLAVNVGNKAPSAITPLRERRTVLTAPEATALKELELENGLLQDILSVKGPTAVDDALFQEFSDTLVKETKIAHEKAGNLQVIDYDVSMDALENITYSEVWGTKKGKYYKSEKNAQKLADEIGGTVVPMGKEEWGVKLERNVPIAEAGGNTLEQLRLFASTNLEELGYGFWSKWGSPLAQTTDNLNAILKQGEAYKAGILDKADRELRVFGKKLSNTQIKGVDEVYSLIRDGAESWRRNPYSPEEFKVRYRKITGEEASPDVVRYYLSLQERNDTAYFLKADELFKNAVNRNVTVLRNDGLTLKVIPSKLDDLPADEFVWNFDSKKMVEKRTLTDEYKVYSMADNAFETPFGEKVQYVVTKRPSTRRLYHSDVLGYNPGGPRVFVGNSAKFFLKQTREATLASGRKVLEAPRTVMAVRLQDEAVAASKAINNIGESLGARLGVGSFDDMLTKLRTLDGDKAISRVILDNNLFDTSIQNAGDLADFLERTGLDIRKKVDWASDGSQLLEEGTNYFPGIDNSKTIVDTFHTQSFRKGSRGNDVLLGFGGDPISTVPPIKSIQRGFAQAVANRSEASYVASSVAGLMKSLMENPKALRKPLDADLAGLSLRAKLGKLGEYINKNTVEGKKLSLERDKIEWRLNKKPEYAPAIEAFNNSVGDALYKTGWKKGAVAYDKWSPDPITAIRGYLFDAWLGLFAWDQLYVQASQIFNIVGMSPVHGMIGAASYAPTKFVLLNGNPKVLERVSSLVGPAMGLTPKQYTEMVTMLKENGRLVTGLSIAELGEDAARSGAVRNLREKGRFFFNEGELVARISAHNAAYRNYVKKFPEGIPTSQHGRRWIAHEQDRLTQAMTSASRSPFQQLPFAQFLSYMWRVNEALLSGSFGGTSRKVLSNREKATVAATHVALYGASGMPGTGYIVDRLYAQKAVDVPPEYINRIRYGILDTALSQLLGTETALSSRLAWGEGITQFVTDMMDKSFIEAIGGPSATFGVGVTGIVTQLIKDISLGSPELLKMDLNVFAKQFKSYNMAYSAYTAVNIGKYYSRNGSSIVDDDVDVHEAIALAFGIPLDEYSNAYRLQSQMYDSYQYEKEQAKRIETILIEAQKKIRSDDYDGVDALYKQVALILRALPPAQSDRVRKLIPRGFNTLLDETYVYATEQDLQVDRGE